MLIWVLAAFVSAFGGIWFTCKLMFGDHKTDNKKKDSLQKNVTLMLLGIAICFVSLMTIKDADISSVRGAQHIANVCVDGSDSLTPIFYDEKTGEYFTVEYNMFSLWNLTDRHILNTDEAQRYISAYKELSKIELFD